MELWPAGRAGLARSRPERQAVVDAQAARDALLLHLPKEAVFDEVDRNPKSARRSPRA
jgi:hypothetical protein